MTWYLQPDHRLSADRAGSGRDQLRYIPSAGVEAGFWWGELLTDQRPVDAFSLTYDSPALTEEVAILGLPRVSLRVAADARLADWFVRLSDVAPDGSVTMVTGAGINGAQRDSMSNPQDLVPGKSYPLSLNLHLASWVFPKGHRIRIAISNALWPMNWPTPYPMTSTMMLGGDSASQGHPAARAGARAAGPRVRCARTHRGASPGSRASARAVPLGPAEWTAMRDEARQRSTVTWKGRTAVSYPWGKFRSFGKAHL